jgi:hypothetical protein
MAPRIMYIENKAGGVDGPGRIGMVSFSKTGKTLSYQGREFRSLDGKGFKANYCDVVSGEEYWISGPKKRGGDKLYGGKFAIDDDVREAYWVEIRKQPESKHRRTAE